MVSGCGQLLTHATGFFWFNLEEKAKSHEIKEWGRNVTPSLFLSFNYRCGDAYPKHSNEEWMRLCRGCAAKEGLTW